MLMSTSFRTAGKEAMNFGLVQCSANYVALSPVSFLERASIVYGDKVSIIYGDLRFSWKETHQRCLKLASALVNLGISHGDTVAAIAPNIPALYELHYGVPMAGAVLSALNTKLDETTLVLLLEQSEAKVIFVDCECTEVVNKVFGIMSQRSCKPPSIVLIPDYDQKPSSFPNYLPANTLTFNDLIANGHSDFEPIRPSNECNPISVNYTSGSTGIPKGVVYSHRAAYLNSLAVISRFDLKQMPVFLWTVDMFRCNGWCFPWAMAAVGGTNICLRNLSAKVIFDAICLHQVTHLCGAPTLLNLIAEAPASDLSPLFSKVNITVAGVFPPFQIFVKVSQFGFNINVGYGMTEALGPVIVRSWKPNSVNSHEELTNEDQLGLHNLTMEAIDVKDPKTMKSTPCDGKTIGEIMFKGNTLMLGYLKNSKGTEEAFQGGWYRTGDLGIRTQDGSIRFRDRAKDMIYSKGKAVSSLEIETVLLSHPKVLKAAVVGKYDESICAIVKLKEGFDATAEEIVKFCEEYLANHMVPESVVFGDLPVNSTGKVQKFVIREKIKSNGCCASIL